MQQQEALWRVLAGVIPPGVFVIYGKMQAVTYGTTYTDIKMQGDLTRETVLQNMQASFNGITFICIQTAASGQLAQLSHYCLDSC
jgi:hypothetical protein